MHSFRNKEKIAIIGLGYVGLPLAVEFGKLQDCIGYDVDQSRIESLRQGTDTTHELTRDEMASAKHVSFTGELQDLADCTVFIVTVPTPVDPTNRPDLSALVNASKAIGSLLKPDSLVIYESTVYPGAIEEDIVPHLEKASGLVFNENLWIGYSPERINPGDKVHRLPDIKKVTSGSTPETADYVDDLYRRIIRAGTYKASSIKVAEAAKVIENTQRDVNIALVNELSLIFSRLGIDTLEVLETAETKWNFLPFRPGLVGGHCIGVDPYYLTHKAQLVGYQPEVILAGRRINDGMGTYVGLTMAKALIHANHMVKGSRILILGVTFKENCPDVRNTRVVDIISELISFGIEVDVYDPDAGEFSDILQEGARQVNEVEDDSYDGIILAVAHDRFVKTGVDKIKNLGRSDCVFFDLKGVFPKEDSDFRL